MHIKPSAAIRKNYNDISTLCRTTKEPVFLTKNGEGDLVVFDMETYARRESMLRLRETLLESERARLDGEKGFTIEETTGMMEKVICEIACKRDE